MKSIKLNTNDTPQNKSRVTDINNNFSNLQEQINGFDTGNTVNTAKATYTGDIDGVNRVFELDRNYNQIQVYINGVYYSSGYTYTKSTKTIVFDFAIPVGFDLDFYGIGVSSFDYADTDLSNLSSTGKAVISNLSMPSNSYSDLVLGASGSTYTAPVDGWYYINKGAGNAGYYLTLSNDTKGYLQFQVTGQFAGSLLCALVPAQKNDVISVTYNATGTTNMFRFIKAQGSV